MYGYWNILKYFNAMGIFVLLVFLLMFGNAKTSQLPFYYMALGFLILTETFHFIKNHRIVLNKYKTLNKYIIWFVVFTIVCYFNISRASISELAKENFGFIWKDCVLVFLLVYWLANSKKVYFFGYYLVAVAYMTLRTLITFVIDYNMDETLNTLGIQFNSIALLASVGAVISFYYAYISKSKKYKIPFYICVVCCLITTSRKSFLLLVGGIILVLLSYGNLTKKVRNITIIIVGVIVGLILINNIPFLYEKFGERMLSIFEFFKKDSSSTDVSIIERLLFQETAIKLFLDNIWFGNGLMSCYANLLTSGSRHVSYAHNNYLELASATGIVGITAYYWIYIVLLIKGIRSYQKLKNNAGLAYLIVLILFMIVQIGQVVYYLNYYVVLLIMIGYNLEKAANEQ